ncbi:hypothetical protein ACFWG6_00310 [Streptomyces erythrochromogenes]|uniref:hypothetical protein n=1 Tax=Streptomyces erythrochromogenes TaxID=285574 RepID=UPI0036281A6C
MERGTEERDGAERELNAYERVLAEDRRVMRELLRVSTGGAHAGLAMTILIVTLVASVGGVRWALIAGAAVASWFTAALWTAARGGLGGRAAARRAYFLTFGWGSWL